MNDNQFQFMKLKFTHDQIAKMFELLYEAIDFVDSNNQHFHSLKFYHILAECV